MSPAPQGGLEVERYIGSCLITQSSRAGCAGKQFQNKPKKGAGVVEGTTRPYAVSPGERLSRGGNSRYQLPPPIHGDFYTPQHGWAGLPLFCVASGNHRRNRKGPASCERCPKPSPPQNYQQRDHEEGNGRSPLTRLAIHTQGAPLIQAGRYNKLGYGRGGGGGPPLRLYRGGDLVVRRTDSNRDSKSAQNKEPGACDSVSVASDESSTNSENSLPRVIKPRKRRKKDRKPPPPQTNNAKPVDELAVQTSNVNNVRNNSAAVVTPTRPAVQPEPRSRFPDKQSAFPADEADAAFLPLCGDELPPGLDQEDGPATNCQCRYCDPAGVIWDVDQRCYSPFLTPPSPTDSRLSFGLRSFDLGPALRRSWSEPSTSPAPQPPVRTRAYSESQQQSLEVSSEIITSPNGHRDIEIKFFSSKPNGTRQFTVEE